MLCSFSKRLSKHSKWQVQHPQIKDRRRYKNNSANNKNGPTVGTIASTLAQYSAIYGYTWARFLLF